MITRVFHPCYCQYTGLKVLYKIFPEGMLTGSVPRTCYPSPPPSARKSSKTPSVKSPPPTAFCVPSTPHKEEFSHEGNDVTQCLPIHSLPTDLDNIQTRLDEALLSGDGKYSVLSHAFILC